jgi:hypothetical protein
MFKIFTNVTGKVKIKPSPPDSYVSDWVVDESNTVIQPMKGRKKTGVAFREPLAYIPIGPGSLQLIEDGRILRDDRRGGFIVLHVAREGFVLGNSLVGYSVNYETGKLEIPHSREVVATYAINL